MAVVPTPGRILRPTLIEWTYALTVAMLATLGFTTESTSTILLAAFLALPSSAVTVPAYYGVYGLLAQVSGANPSSSTGSASCAPNGNCQSSTTGDAAAWFTLATDVVGIVALTAAALLNVVVLRSLIAARRTRVQTPTLPGR
jgi:hypothetical protein